MVRSFSQTVPKQIGQFSNRCNCFYIFLHLTEYDGFYNFYLESLLITKAFQLGSKSWHGRVVILHHVNFFYTCYH